MGRYRWAGEDAQNDVDDWNKYKYEYYNHRPVCFHPCWRARTAAAILTAMPQHDHTLDLADVAAEFSGFNVSSSPLCVQAAAV